MMPPSLENPHTCRHCQRIVIAPFPSPINGTERPSVHPDGELILHGGHRENEDDVLTVEFLDEAAKDGCNLCEFLLRLGAPLNPGEKHASVVGFAEGGAGVDTVTFQSGDNGVHFHLLDSTDGRVKTNLHARPIKIHTSSDHTFSLAQQWLTDCLSSHASCIPPNNTFKPTRLVEITRSGADWQVRLMRPSSAVKYVALSYCWGAKQTVLTKAVEKEWQCSIRKALLPQTIRDAIYATMRLGLQYLWVDSLCIIQEDSLEKSQEISKMKDVYSSAIFTLAASSATTAHDGFLRDRETTDFPEEVFSLNYETYKHETCMVTLFRPVQSLISSFPDQAPDPLSRQGWAYQERWLSTRLLDFTPASLQWRCLGSVSGHSCSDGWMPNGEATFHRSTRVKEPLSTWQHTVKSFTERKLTVPSDRILALSGVAQVMHQDYFTNGAYWAGIWECECPLDLTWATGRCSDFGMVEKLLPRPTKFQGPSWSWVAVNTRIYHQPDLRKFAALLKVEKCEIDLFDSNAPYGAVTGGRLHVSSIITRAKLLWSKFESLWKYGTTRSDYQWDLEDEQGVQRAHQWIDLDALEPEFAAKTSGKMEVYLLEVLQIKEECKRTDSCGLILRRHSDGVFSSPWAVPTLCISLSGSGRVLETWSATKGYTDIVVRGG